jgi:hypothetical protein
MTRVVETYVWTTETSWNEELAYSVVDGHNVRHNGVYPVVSEFFPEPPQDVIAQVIDFNSINVYWNPPPNEIPSGYYIYLDGEMLGTSPGCSFQYSSFDAGEYTLAVSAYYDDQQSELVYADPVEVILHSPENLQFEVDTQTPAVNLFWDFPVERGLEAFIIYRDGEEIDQVEDLTYIDENVEAEFSYEYFVTALYSGDYESEASNTVEVFVTDSPYDEIPGTETRLLGNYPNPFNPHTEIRFQISEVRGEGTGSSWREDVELVIYNIKGEKIKKYLISNNVYSVTWDGTDDNSLSVPSGIYFYQLKTGDFKESRKMLLLK